jgi:hypothetical protein
MPLDLIALHTVGVRITDAVAAEAHDSILLPAQQRIPVDTGRARASGQVIAEGTQVWVSFGRDDDGDGGAPSNDYIEELHENAEAHHAQGQPFFLRTAADEAASGFAERLVRRVRI